MIILTLFGTTVGLELQYFPLTNNSPSLKLEDAWIGVTPSQLSLHEDKDSAVILRKTVSEHLATWIGLYRPAREMGYDRPGGFYGAGVWIIDHVVDASLLKELLCEMANQIQAKTMNEDSFVKKIADVRNDFTPPRQVKSILASLTKANSGFKPEGESAFILEASNVIDVIEWAQRAQSASYFSKAVLGTADQIPNAGLSSALRLFTSHSLAVDAAYQHLYSDFRSKMSEANNRIEHLSENIIKLKEKIVGLNDDLTDARRELQRLSNASRVQPNTATGQHIELHIATQEAQNYADKLNFDESATQQDSNFKAVNSIKFILFLFVIILISFVIWKLNKDHGFTIF